MDLIQLGQQGGLPPHDMVKLPTEGIFYRNKKKSLKVGYLTASDENLLMGSDLGNSDGLILTLLKTKIFESDIKPEELMDGDIQALLIFLRNTAFGPEYNFTLVDPETNKEFSATILLDELNIKKGDVLPNEFGIFETVLPKSGKQVKLKPLCIGEQNEIEKLALNYPVGRIPPKQTWRLNKMIVEMDGSTDVGYISQEIEKLPISDAKYVRKFIEENEPRLDLAKKVKAPSGKEVAVNIAFGVEFFRPFF
jgi:hypothetical protein